MTINLADIPAAVATYMNTKVTVAVDEVIADSGSLNPDFDLVTTLEVGEERELLFEVKGMDEGDATVTYHFHANIDQASLFPTGETSTTIGRPVSVV